MKSKLARLTQLEQESFPVERTSDIFVAPGMTKDENGKVYSSLEAARKVLPGANEYHAQNSETIETLERFRTHIEEI